MTLSLYSVPVSVPSLAGPRVSLDENGYNQRLAERRAQSVKAYLVSKGVAAIRLDTVGRGEQDPVAPNTKTAGTT